MNKQKGKLIVFEGLDYSFKETNSKKLVEYIKDNITDKVILLSFPNYNSESSYFIKKYLNGDYQDLDNIDEFTISEFYCMDRFDTINKLNINKRLKEGYYVICDRYTSSNFIFQGAKTNNLDFYILWNTSLEYKKYRLPEEDVNIFMNMPIEVSYPLIKNRKLKNNQEKDIHESNFRYLKRVENHSKEIIKRLKYEVVECTSNGLIRNEIEIFNDILKIFNKVINNQ